MTAIKFTRSHNLYHIHKCQVTTTIFTSVTWRLSYSQVSHDDYHIHKCHMTIIIFTSVTRQLPSLQVSLENMSNIPSVILCHRGMLLCRQSRTNFSFFRWQTNKHKEQQHQFTEFLIANGQWGFCEPVCLAVWLASDSVSKKHSLLLLLSATSLSDSPGTSHTWSQEAVTPEAMNQSHLEPGTSHTWS